VKILICGKGGSGKSTLTTLIARALKGSGRTVLVVDADESNLCLHRLLGAKMPAVLMDAMGGRKGVKEQLNPNPGASAEAALLKDPLTLADIPETCLADADGIKLLVVGKIRSFGEGCACMMGNISKAILTRLREAGDEVVLIDAEAGLEHFGRRVDAGCDLILCVVDPTFESFALAERVAALAASAGVEVVYVLNKVEDGFEATMRAKLDSRQMQIIAAIPRSERLFVQSLNGEALDGAPPEVQQISRFITGYSRPKRVGLTVL
jgi:CO dehydrogenase maturation factor